MSIPVTKVHTYTIKVRATMFAWASLVKLLSVWQWRNRSEAAIILTQREAKPDE